MKVSHTFTKFIFSTFLAIAIAALYGEFCPTVAENRLIGHIYTLSNGNFIQNKFLNLDWILGISISSGLESPTKR